MKPADNLSTGHSIDLTPRGHRLDRSQHLLLKFIRDMDLAQLQVDEHQLFVLNCFFLALWKVAQ